MIFNKTPVLTVVGAGENEKLLHLAYDFVLPYEKHCCALMQRIIHSDSSIQLIVEEGTQNSCAPQIHGVFTYNGTGRLVFSCLPDQGLNVFLALKKFFSTRSVFCFSGYAPYEKFLENVYKSVKYVHKTEVHDYYLMHFSPDLPGGKQLFKKDDSIIEENCAEYLKDCSFDLKDAKLIQCNLSHTENLIPLQIEYEKVEVNPKWREVYIPGVRATVEQTLKNQFVFAIQNDKEIAAKANSNAISEHYLQIGGVFTQKKYRGKGYACMLVKKLSATALEHNKRAVLFVKEKNESAKKAYLNAGFKPVGKYRIKYFCEE